MTGADDDRQIFNIARLERTDGESVLLGDLIDNTDPSAPTLSISGGSGGGGGAVSLAANDAGLVAQTAAVVGAVGSRKTLFDLYNILAATAPETGITIKTLPAITGTVTASGAFTNSILTAVEDQDTHYLAVRDSVLATLLGTTLYDATTHYLSVKDGPLNTLLGTTLYDQTTHYIGTKDGALNTLLGTTLYDQTTHYIGTKDGALNTLLGTTLYDQTTHWLGTKDVSLTGCITNNQVAVALSSQAFTNSILTAVEDQTTHYLATKDVAIKDCISANRLQADIAGAVTNSVLTAVEDQTGTYTHWLAVKSEVLAAVEDQLTHYLAVREAPSTSIVSGQNASIPANASTAVILTTSQACSEVTIQAPAANNVSILFGSGTGTCYMELAPGRDYTIPVSNVNLIYVKSSTADTSPKVNWIARA